MRFPPVVVAAILLVCCVHPAASAQEVPYGVGDWPEANGNHRAKVRVEADAKANAVWIHLPWRRRDADPDKKQIVIVDERTNQPVKNVLRVRVERESGDLLFQPPTVPGDYSVYYMPYRTEGEWYFPRTVYLPPTNDADAAWIKAVETIKQKLVANQTDGLPAAKVLEFQAINEFHRFDPMEVPATAAEMKELLANHASEPYLVFPEDRRYPIRMRDELPLRWIKSGPARHFAGETCRGEYYTFQLGIYAATQDLKQLRVRFEPFRSQDEAHSIDADAITCFNQGGTDWRGKHFDKRLDVAKGTVQPLWIGLQIPPDAARDYRGAVIIEAENLPATTVKIDLAVKDQLLADAGDGDLWRQSRLRWLNSTIGLDEDVSAPFTRIERSDRTLKVLGRSMRFGSSGLPESIQSTFSGSIDRTDAPPREVLAAPIRFSVAMADGAHAFTDSEPKIVHEASGAVAWEVTSQSGPLTLHTSAKLESDGYVNYRLTLSSSETVELKDTNLEIPFRREVARYMMGLGRKGGTRPQSWDWKWDVNFANGNFWIGDVNAGLSGKFKHREDRWDLYTYKQSGVYEAWGNGGQGGCRLREEGDDRVVLRTYTGPRKLEAKKELSFNFGLLITPTKTLDKHHWQWRYMQGAIPPAKEVAAKGANVLNIHQGNALNPNINYPFLHNDTLKKYIDEAHAEKVRVKLYYTVRELSNYTAEFWALRSLGDEIFSKGPGFRLADQFAKSATPAAKEPTGSSWLCEHVITDYTPAWHQPLGNGVYDASLATQGLSRWHNYYLEGLNWLIRNLGVDGLYLDGVGYDREIMKRVRKVMDRAHPGCLIDFHSGNNFHPEYGMGNCASQYMELFPYIDSLWFGEGFDYNETPDYWLVEISGIPYGLFGEMLEGGGNPWRGMLYGMANRLGWANSDPRAMWKLWDEFGIDQARMIGYWDPACPIHTDNKDVLATAYCKDGKVLVAVASWSKEPAKVRLNIDWKALGLEAGKVCLSAPAIEGLQTAKALETSEPIAVDPGKGFLLLMKKQ